MKKKVLSLAVIAAFVGSITTGCSSQKNASSGDTTSKDTTKVSAPAAPLDTMKKDSSTKDTTKKP